MADKGIIFSAPMVRALLDGRKTQTRRLISCAVGTDYHRQTDGRHYFGFNTVRENGQCGVQLPRLPYAIGDRLYVREAHGFNHYGYERGRAPKQRPAELTDEYLSYLATEDDCEIANELLYRPSIHMPRWASRMWLAVTDVRVQRLREISEEDAIAEGLVPVLKTFPPMQGCPGALRERTIYEWESGWSESAVPAYAALWNTLHTAEGERWEDNPWICAVSFSVHMGNIDSVTTFEKDHA